MARPIDLIPHLFRLAGALKFRKDYSPPLVRYLDRSPRATHSSGAVTETEEEQDIAIGEVADAEAKEEIQFASDSSDDDYHLPIPDLPPR